MELHSWGPQNRIQWLLWGAAWCRVQWWCRCTSTLPNLRTSRDGGRVGESICISILKFLTSSCSQSFFSEENRAEVELVYRWKLWNLSAQSLSNHRDGSNSSNTYKLGVLTFNDLRCHWRQLTVNAVPENNMKGNEKSTEEYLRHFKKKEQAPWVRQKQLEDCSIS